MTNLLYSYNKSACIYTLCLAVSDSLWDREAGTMDASWIQVGKNLEVITLRLIGKHYRFILTLVLETMKTYLRCLSVFCVFSLSPMCSRSFPYYVFSFYFLRVFSLPSVSYRSLLWLLSLFPYAYSLCVFCPFSLYFLSVL